MKGQVTDPEFLLSIRSVDVQLYLRSRGWKPIATTMQTEAVDWELTGVDRSVEVTVPRNARWRDYARRVREVLAELSQLEGRSENAIAQDIQRASRDIIRMRAVVDNRTDGSIPLEDGALLARSARALMLAAACAAHEPRRAYGPRKPAPATEYLRGLSMGQTEVGSFVLTVLSPVPPAFTQQTALPFVDAAATPDHYNRRVTRTLSTALGAVTRATEASIATGDITPFDDAVAEGVSADLCESLGILDGNPRKVRIAVFGEDWTKAHDAMKLGLLLSCRGELTREGKHYVLRNPRSISAIAPDADER